MNELEEIKQNKIRELLSKRRASKMQTIIEVNDENFEREVIEKSKKTPVVVDFWATWCMPCRILGPVLEKLVKEYRGKLVLAKLNVDQNQNTSTKYRVMSIPSVKMFKNERIVDEFIGALPEPMVKQWLEKNLSGKDF